jgi:hypothetical protein
MGKFANPGDSKQIGGEFVFSSTGQPTWCHRMEVRASRLQTGPARLLLMKAWVTFPTTEHARPCSVARFGSRRRSTVLALKSRARLFALLPSYRYPYTANITYTPLYLDSEVMRLRGPRLEHALLGLSADPVSACLRPAKSNRPQRLLLHSLSSCAIKSDLAWLPQRVAAECPLPLHR